MDFVEIEIGAEVAFEVEVVAVAELKVVAELNVGVVAVAELKVGVVVVELGIEAAVKRSTVSEAEVEIGIDFVAALLVFLVAFDFARSENPVPAALDSKFLCSKSLFEKILYLEIAPAVDSDPKLAKEPAVVAVAVVGKKAHYVFRNDL